MSDLSKIELGGGNRVNPGFTSIDIIKHTPDTIQWNLEEGLPPSIKPNSVSEMVADNVLEHIDNVVDLMNACHTALKEGGRFTIKVPKAGTVGDFKDPTHKRHFLVETFDYFLQNEYLAEIDRQPNYGQKKWKPVKVIEEDCGRGSEAGTGRYINIVAVLEK